MSRTAVTAALAAAALVAAGCGTTIEDTVASQYPDYAAQQGFAKRVRHAKQVTCDTRRTAKYDGTCTIHPTGVSKYTTYKVPYKGQQVLWGDSHMAQTLNP